MASLFNGNFETGNGSQWDSLSDETTNIGTAGRSTLLSTYTTGTGLTVTPSAGATTVMMARSVLKPDPGTSGQPGSTRAEWVDAYNYANYHNQTVYISWALLLDPDTNWLGSWSGGTSNHSGVVKLGQNFGRNLSYPGGLCLSVTGYEGLPGLSVGWWGWGGEQTTAGGNPFKNEHRLSMNPAVGNGWTSFLSPTAAEAAGSQRYPQILGPRCQQGQNIPVTVGEWWEFIVRMDMRTDVATGMYQAWVRKRGSGATWTKTMESPASYKTIAWRASAGQPANSSGANNVHRIGGYLYDLPANISFFWDQFTISTTFAEAEAQFASESGGPPVIPFLFTGDFEVGDGSQWDGLFDETTVVGTTGQGFVLSGYQTAGVSGIFVTPDAGVTKLGMARSLLKPGVETRAERAKGFDYANYHNSSVFFTFAFLLDPDFSWTFDWTADATNADSAVVLAHILQRNLGGITTRLNLHPPGWEGETEPVLSFVSNGGESVSFGDYEHRIACDPAAGNGWTTLLDPTTAEGTNAKRYPQIIGPHCQQGQAIELTVGEWWEVIIQVDCRTDAATGGYSAWVRKRGSGPFWTKTLDTTRIYKTVGWRGTTQPPTSSGSNNQHRVGGLAANLPGNRSYFWDQFTVRGSFETASAVFAEETFSIPHTTHPSGTRITGTRITGTRVSGVGIL